MVGRALNWYILLAVAFTLAFPAGATDLRHIVEYTLKTHPGVEASRADQRATGYQLQQSKGRLFPEINLRGDLGLQKVDKRSNQSSADNDKWFERKEITVSVTQVLFDGWQRSYDIQRNSARLNASALRVLGTAETSALDAIDVYIDVLRNQKLVSLARQNVTRHQEILGVVQAQYDGGRAPLSDVSQIRGRVGAAEAAVAVMRQSHFNARSRFRRVVGMEASNLKKVRMPSGLPGSKIVAVNRGIANNPDFKAAVADVEAAGYAYDQSAGTLLPQIALEGNATSGYDVGGISGRNEDLSVKLTFSWKLFDGAIRKNRRRELSERLIQAQSNQTLRQRNIVETIEQSWNSLITGRERVGALAKQVKASKAVVSDFLEEYELSKRTLLEVLDAESLLFNARVQSLSAEAIRTLAGYQALAAMGELLSSMNISPPAEAYIDAKLENVDWTGPFNTFIEPLR